ncbi:hypothetical protein A3F66_04270 [candidate division TM6 bacterium RIFCSPHIGHO2_12_FULL_32_22]|nr:MAG: hypothetical protein A3F66_04270 [candidate division TM6 bacterium RIFCSPHIGHO2_12_FULL_32_22]
MNSWSLVKIVLVIFFVFIFKSSFSRDAKSSFWTYISYFENHTDYEYKVYKACNPAVRLEERDWIPLLNLLPYNGDPKSKYYVGTIDEGILLKDPLDSGCVIKIEPVLSGKKSEASIDKQSEPQTFYIRTGLKSSGNCVYRWLTGPYETQVSPIDFVLLDNPEDSNLAKPDIQKIRHCGYQDSVLGVKIFPKSIQFVARHRAYVLDTDKYPVVKDK